jgi:hypothetical protein
MAMMLCWILIIILLKKIFCASTTSLSPHSFGLARLPPHIVRPGLSEPADALPSISISLRRLLEI